MSENSDRMEEAIRSVRKISDDFIRTLPEADEEASAETDRLVAKMCEGRKRWIVPTNIAREYVQRVTSCLPEANDETEAVMERRTREEMSKFPVCRLTVRSVDEVRCLAEGVCIKKVLSMPTKLSSAVRLWLDRFDKDPASIEVWQNGREWVPLGDEIPPYFVALVQERCLRVVDEHRSEALTIRPQHVP